VEALAEGAKRKGAEALLTTGKDAVKIAPASFARSALPLYVIRMETELPDPSALGGLLERLRR
jgi:tetraacyldisaccharide-1-P 4'-kinase